MIQSGSVATPIMCALAPISEASLSNTLITFDDSNKLRILHESTRHAIERRRKTRDRHCQQNASGAQNAPCGPVPNQNGLPSGLGD